MDKIIYIPDTVINKYQTRQLKKTRKLTITKRPAITKTCSRSTINRGCKTGSSTWSVASRSTAIRPLSGTKRELIQVKYSRLILYKQR